MSTLRNPSDVILCRKIDKDEDSIVECSEKSCFASWSFNGTTTIAEKGCGVYDNGCGDDKCEAYFSESTNDTHSPMTSYICCCKQDYCNESVFPSPILINTATSNSRTESQIQETKDSILSTSEFQCMLVAVIVILIVLSLYFSRQYLQQTVKCIKSERIKHSSLQTSWTDQEQKEWFISGGMSLKVETEIHSTTGHTIYEGRYGRITLGTVGDKQEKVCLKEFYTSTTHGRNLYEVERRSHEVLRRFNHQNIVTYFGKVAESGINANQKIALEYCEEGSLRQYLIRHIIDLRCCLRLLRDITEAVSFLHNPDPSVSLLGMAHRDISSSNFLVRSDTTVVISDFGFSQLLSNSETEISARMDLTAVGTLNYMAPEILRGTMNLKNRVSALKQADVYSTALVMWEVMNRCSALHGTLEDVPNATVPYQIETREGQSLYDVVVLQKSRPAFPPVRKVSKKMISVSSSVSTDSGNIKDISPTLTNTSADTLFQFTDERLSAQKSVETATLNTKDSRTAQELDLHGVDSNTARGNLNILMVHENQYPIALLKRTIHESWDADEDARLSSSGIFNRVASCSPMAIDTN